MPNDMPNDQAPPTDNDEGQGMLEEMPHEALVKKLSEAERKVQQHWERILRMQADNENLARRTERDIVAAHKYALEKFAGDLLPIVDSLELAVKTDTGGDKTADAVIEGVNLTLKLFYTTLEKYGVKQVNPVGEVFDPEFSQAIQMQFDPKCKPGTVVSVLQKGYTLNNRLLRPALVVVAKAEQ